MTKSIAHIIFCILFLHPVRSWTINPKPEAMIQKATAAAFAAVLLAGPQVADAVDFNGNYADPKHQNCLRSIQVPGGSTTAQVSGTDGTPSCPKDGTGRPWKLTGTIKGDNILVDFSPKGGPANLEGQWESSPTPGIRWPDGNLWSLLDTTKAEM